MKTREQIQRELNKLIDYADAKTADDHLKLGAILTSAGAGFMAHGGASEAEMQYAALCGVRASRGQTPPPIPGSDPQ